MKPVFPRRLFACILVVITFAPASPGALAPRRVVSLVPAATEMLFAMGAGDLVVGVSNYDSFPPEALTRTKVGGLLDPNLERILALKPDLVIVYATQMELKGQLARVRIPTFDYVHRGLAEVTGTIRRLGRQVEAAGAGAVADRIDADLARIAGRLQGRSRPKTLLVIGREPGSLGSVLASGGYGFLHDMLEIAGANDAVGDVPRESVTLSTEAILTRAPEVIIELHYGAALKSLDLDAERRVWGRLQSVPAVRNGRVHLLAGDEYVVPGPRVVIATERLARTLHPDAFQ